MLSTAPTAAGRAATSALLCCCCSCGELCVDVSWRCNATLQPLFLVRYSLSYHTSNSYLTSTYSLLCSHRWKSLCNCPSMQTKQDMLRPIIKTVNATVGQKLDMAHAVQGFAFCVVARQPIMPMHKCNAEVRCGQAELSHLLYITRAAGARAACIALLSSLVPGSAAMAVIRATPGQLAADGCNRGRALASSPSDRNRALMPSSLKPTSKHLQPHSNADHIGCFAFSRCGCLLFLCTACPLCIDAHDNTLTVQPF